MNDALILCNHTIPEATKAVAETDSVPEQSSSPRIKLNSFDLFKISLSSNISTANEDNPAQILS